MKPDRIKISIEFNVMGSGLWLTAESPIAPEEDVIQEFKNGKQLLMDAFKEMGGDNFYYRKTVSSSVYDKKLEEEINHQFEITKQKVLLANTKELAEAYMFESGFSLNVELKNIANLKPSINGKVK